MTTNSDRSLSFTFTTDAWGELFELHWAWVNEDDSGITWNIIRCASIDEIAFAFDTLPEDVYVRFAAPAAWMARSRKAARMAAKNREAALVAAYADDMPIGEEVPF